jgi:hypothetical protein
MCRQISDTSNVEGLSEKCIQISDSLHPRHGPPMSGIDRPRFCSACSSNRGVVRPKRACVIGHRCRLRSARPAKPLKPLPWKAPDRLVAVWVARLAVADVKRRWRPHGILVCSRGRCSRDCRRSMAGCQPSLKPLCGFSNGLPLVVLGTLPGVPEGAAGLRPARLVARVHNSSGNNLTPLDASMYM